MTSFVDPYELGAWKVEGVFHRARFLRQKCYVEDKNKPETWDKQKFSTKRLKKECEKNGLNFEEEILKFDGCYDTDSFAITCAGMPESCYDPVERFDNVNWENFRIGMAYMGKLVPKHVKGGIVLVPDCYTIRPS